VKRRATWRSLFALVGAACAIAASVTPARATSSTPPAAPIERSGALPARQATTIGMRLIEQPMTVAPDATLNVTVAVEGDIPSDAVLSIVDHRPMRTRDEIAQAIAGDLPTRQLDSLDIPIGFVPRDSKGQLAIPINTQSTGRDRLRLRMPDPGVYALVLSIEQDGNVLGELTTFVERVDTQAPPRTVGISVMLTLDSPPVLQPDGLPTITDAARQKVDQLTSLLRTSPVPLTVLVRPDLLNGMTNGDEPDQARVQQFATQLGTRHELMAETSISLDPTATARAGLADLFTDQLALGEDQVSSATNADAERSTWLVTNGIAAEGLRQLRNLGVRHIVLSRSAVGGGSDDALGGALGQIAIGDDTSLPAMAADPAVQSELSNVGSDPVLTAHQVAADLIALGLQANDQAAQGGSQQGRGVIITAGEVGQLDDTLLRTLLSLVQQSPELTPRTATDSLSELVRTTRESDRVGVVSAEPSLPDLTPLKQTLDRLDKSIDVTDDMLPFDDPRPDHWRELESVMPADNIPADQQKAYANTIDSEITAVQSAIQPPEQGSITLGGRASEIPITIENTGDTPLKVLLQLRSPKLQFPEGDQVHEIAPGRQRVDIPVVARSNGRFPVSVQIFTPDGSTALSAPTTVTVESSALTGKGQLVTGAFVLILASWWFQHVRRSRQRKRATAAGVAQQRHPTAH
jgi:hypothetical protein